MKGIDIDEMVFGMPDDTGAGDDLGGIGGEGVGTDGADGAAGMDDDPMSVLRRNPTVRNMVTVTFTRDAFLKRLDTAGLDNPEETYRMFGAVMDVDGEGGLKPISADFDLADSRFSPTGSQRSPNWPTVNPVRRPLTCWAHRIVPDWLSSEWTCCSMASTNSTISPGTRRSAPWKRPSEPCRSSNRYAIPN